MIIINLMMTTTRKKKNFFLFFLMTLFIYFFWIFILFFIFRIFFSLMTDEATSVLEFPYRTYQFQHAYPVSPITITTHYREQFPSSFNGHSHHDPLTAVVEFYLLRVLLLTKDLIVLSITTVVDNNLRKLIWPYTGSWQIEAYFGMVTPPIQAINLPY